MYYQNYEDYMRQVLGYPINDPSIYETYNYRNDGTYANNHLRYSLTEVEINELYPESYNLIYPLVCRTCDTINEPISSASIEKMTDEIYKMVEKNQTVVNVKIGIESRKSEPKKITNLENNKLSARQEMKRNSVQTSLNRELTPKRISIKSENRENPENQIRTENTFNRFNANIEGKEKYSNEIENIETRQQNNPLLRDLIKILILQRLFDVNRPPRPNPPRQNYPPVKPPFLDPRIQVGMNRANADYTDYL